MGRSVGAVAVAVLLLATSSPAAELRDDAARFTLPLPAGWKVVDPQALVALKEAAARLGGARPAWTAAAYHADEFAFDAAHVVMTAKPQPGVKPWHVDALASNLQVSLDERLRAGEALRYHDDVQLGDVVYDRERLVITFPWTGTTRLRKVPLHGRVALHVSSGHIVTVVVAARDPAVVAEVAPERKGAVDEGARPRRLGPMLLVLPLLGVVAMAGFVVWIVRRGRAVPPPSV